MVQNLETETPSQIIYPESDGQPMADNTLQFRWIVKIKENLDILFAEVEDVFVAGDLLWYPVEGSNNISQAPDIMVVFGRQKGERGSYLQWLEDNISPQVVFEILSPSNTQKEMAKKFEFYRKYGVEEYYLFDPRKIEFCGWMRSEGELTVIDAIENWVSPRLNIRFELTAETLEIYYPDGKRFLTPVELAKRAEEAEKRAEEERQRAELAEARIKILEERLREAGIDPEQLQ
ncbi:Uma2 family endonuclease [Capilliphycus salinus ALCB114379]|uniref:Uma2 family endonuclease n=1 Tax=Capilliphycus salinus TaxID=2768948 RepID=UPI0039A506C8